VQRICGAEAAKFWRFFVLGNVLLKTGSVTALLPQQLHSGEITTSLTNTIMNQMMISYAFERLGRKLGTDFDFLCEGDDNIIFSNSRADIEAALNIIKSLGFSAITEHYSQLSDIEFVG